MGDVQEELRVKKSEDARRKAKVNQLTVQLNSLQNDLANMDDTEDVQASHITSISVIVCVYLLNDYTV